MRQTFTNGQVLLAPQLQQLQDEASIVVATTTERDALPTTVKTCWLGGLLYVRNSGGSWEGASGTTGTLTTYPNWADIGGASAGMWATRSGPLVTIEGTIVRTNSSLAITANTLYQIITVPAGFLPAHNVSNVCTYALVTGGQPVATRLVITSGGVVSFTAVATGTISINGYLTFSATYRGE